MRHFIWISFDLGVKGDYEGLYEWLDEHDARECGDNLACFAYEHRGDLSADLKRNLTKALDIDSKTRIYVIYRDVSKKKMKGTFRGCPAER